MEMNNTPKELNEVEKILQERTAGTPVNNTDNVTVNQPMEKVVNAAMPTQQYVAPGDELFIGAEQASIEAEQRSERLMRFKMEDEIPDMLPNSIDDSESVISGLLDEIDVNSKKHDLELDDTDLESLLSKLESEKTYSTVEETKDLTGTSDYEVLVNEEYVSNIEEICESNNIRIVKKNNAERNAILDRYANSGTNVSMALINSGIYVNFSGAGPAEVIAMNQLPNGSPAAVELSKLNHVAQHITGSTIGRMTINKLIKVVSYYDKDSLYYGLYAGTYPDASELNNQCEKDGHEYYIKTRTADLLLNPDDFGKRAEYIRNDVTTFEELMKASELGKLYKKVHSSGIIITYKHPSIESYLNTRIKLTPDTYAKYSNIIELAYGIEKITIHDKGFDFIHYTDPNDIVTIIGKLKTADERYEIADMLQEVRPHAVPVYGFKDSKCPQCGHVNPQQSFQMDQ